MSAVLEECCHGSTPTPMEDDLLKAKKAEES
jgi:hypothetical protein